MEEPLLTPDTYAVLRVVPLFWMDEQLVVSEIASLQKLSKTSVGHRLVALRSHHLIERRECRRHGFRYELRKIAKDE